MFNKNETLATLTKREYFIIEIAKSFVSRSIPVDSDGEPNHELDMYGEDIVESSIEVADLLISALEDEG